MKKVKVISVVIGALGAISDKFDKHTEEIGVQIRLQVIQKTALLGDIEEYFVFVKTQESALVRPLLTCC